MHTSIEYDTLKQKLNELNNDTSHFNNSNDVCTPMSCVEEMVDTIPGELWERENINILDPCAGNGNFPAYVLQRLKNSFFITINELSDKRLEYLNNFFTESENVKITQKDFLADTFEETYDLIIANPPYALFTNKKRAAKNHGISKAFIAKSLDLLNENGYLVFIVPDNWMSRSDRNDIAYRLSFYQFTYLNIHGAKKYFPKVGSSFTWFVLKKEDNQSSFIVDNNYIKEEKSIVSLDKGVYSIPLFYNNIVRSILNKTIYENHRRLNIETSSDLHKYTKKSLLSEEKDESHQYELVHTPTQRVFSERAHKFQCGWKVFISLTSYYSTFIEKDVGATQSIAFIRVEDKEQAETIKGVLDHPLYRFINNIHRYGNFNNIRILQKFPYPDNVDNIWESFDITEDEKDFIYSFLGIT